MNLTITRMLLRECSYGRAAEKSSKDFAHATHATKLTTRS